MTNKYFNRSELNSHEKDPEAEMEEMSGTAYAAARDVWIPTDRELPPLGQEVLVRVVTPDSRPWLSVACRKNIEFRWEWVLLNGSILCNRVTHWRTLMPDPDQDGDRQELDDLLTFAETVGLVVHCKSEASTPQI